MVWRWIWILFYMWHKNFIFSVLKHGWKYFKILSDKWKKFHIQRQHFLFITFSFFKSISLSNFRHCMRDMTWRHNRLLYITLIFFIFTECEKTAYWKMRVSALWTFFCTRRCSYKTTSFEKEQSIAYIYKLKKISYIAF